MPDKKLHLNRCAPLIGFFLILLSTSACAPVFKMVGIPLKVHCIGTGITSVSASSDSSTFVVSYCDGKKSLIATGEYDSGETKIVLKSNDSLLQRPIFLNRDGDIGFIERSTVDKSTIKVVHRDGSIGQLTNAGPDSNNIRDIALGPEGATIYYLNSRSYGRSSPVGSDMPHDNDFYALSIQDKSLKRLSFSSAYHLSGLSISRDGKTIFGRSEVLESGETIFKDLKFKVDERLPFTADRLTYTSEHPLSPVSTKDQMILSCGKVSKVIFGDYPVVQGYGLFLIQLPERTATKELLYVESHLNSPAILEKNGVVLFIRQPFEKPLFRKLKRELWAVKLDGSDLKRINLPGVE